MRQEGEEKMALMVRRRRRGSVIVDTPDGILVVSERGRTYLLPGGVAKRHESRQSAAIRELREETGLEAIDFSYLFEYRGKVHVGRNGRLFRNAHKVFLAKTNGVAEPRSEIKHLAYFDGSNVHVSLATRRIIEKYREIKNSAPEHAQLKCSNCGATLEANGLSASTKCERCGTIYHRNGRIFED
jgi:8-oxo-dGTP diphosphatase